MIGCGKGWIKRNGKYERCIEWCSQVDCINGPHCKSWEDYRRGAHATFNGGHHDDPAHSAFHHGMDTVFNLLEGEFPPAELCKTAPDLLAVVRAVAAECRDTFIDPDEMAPEWIKILAAADAAIAKATGEPCP